MLIIKYINISGLTMHGKFDLEIAALSWYIWKDFGMDYILLSTTENLYFY